MENLLFLGVPILKHFRVIVLMDLNFENDLHLVYYAFFPRCDNKTMEGELCEKSICRTWCFNDAECVNCQLHTYNSLATAGQCEKCM